MKRLFNTIIQSLLCLIFVSILCLAGCQQQGVQMVLQPTEIIPDKVLENYTEDSKPISFDFCLSDEVYLNYSLIQYELVDGKWTNRTNFHGHVLNNASGLIALNPNRDNINMIITTVAGTIESGQIRNGDIGISSNESSYNPNIDDRYKYISLTDRVEITYEEEIPILVQVNTEDKLTQTFTNEEELANLFKDYEEVFLIKVVFSKEYLK